MTYEPVESGEVRPGHMNPDPERHDSIRVYDENSELTHEFEELCLDPADDEKIKFRAKLSDKAGVLLENIEGWMEKKHISEAGEMKIWFKEHNKEIASASAATVIAVALGSLVVRHRKQR